MDLLFVCLSDLHLGEEDSLLTNLASDPPELRSQVPGPCMTALVNHLHALKRSLNGGGRIPFLILNGDIAELAVAGFPAAATCFRSFLFEVARREIFDRIIYIPGNHDHALWSLIRDHNFTSQLKHMREDSEPPAVIHTTPLSLPRTSGFLEDFVASLPMHAPSPPLLVAYPMLRLPFRSGGDFFFHHGHFLEDVYRSLSLLWGRLYSDAKIEELRSRPLHAFHANIAQVEQENWPWLDFVWSGFTRAGRVGQSMEDLYELLISAEGPEVLMRRLASILDDELNIPVVPDWLEKRIFPWLVERATKEAGYGSVERADPKRAPFNEELQELTSRFVRYFIRGELEYEGYEPARDQSTFVFSHTHKPFLAHLDLEEEFGALRIANTGGWIVDSYTDKESHHRAGLVVGRNDGAACVVSYSLSSKGKPRIESQGGWDRTIELLPEHEKLALAILRAAALRRPHLKQRVEKTRRVMKNLG